MKTFRKRQIRLTFSGPWKTWDYSNQPFPVLFHCCFLTVQASLISCPPAPAQYTKMVSVVNTHGYVLGLLRDGLCQNTQYAKELSVADKAGLSVHTLLENCKVLNQSHCKGHLIIDATDLKSSSLSKVVSQSVGAVTSGNSFCCCSFNNTESLIFPFFLFSQFHKTFCFFEVVVLAEAVP